MPTETNIFPNTQVCATGTHIPFRKAGHKLTISTVVKSMNLQILRCLPNSAEEAADNVKYHKLRYTEVTFGKYWRKKWEKAKFG